MFWSFPMNLKNESATPVRPITFPFLKFHVILDIDPHNRSVSDFSPIMRSKVKYKIGRRCSSLCPLTFPFWMFSLIIRWTVLKLHMMRLVIGLHNRLVYDFFDFWSRDPDI